MSPIYEWECPFCGHYKQKMQTEPNIPECDECCTKMNRVPSRPGYRRDHTVKGDKK